MKLLPTLLALLFPILACHGGETLSPATKPPGLPAAGLAQEGIYAEFVTPRGTITCELFFAKTPLTVASFVGLAEGTLGPKPGTPFFDGLKFHRVVPGFVVQGGDPLGTGEGGPGYEFADELVPGLRHDDAGILSMANAGPDTNGSQFFLTLAPVNRLNYLHTVFGRTVRGREILPLIQQDDVITAVRIHRIGAAATAFRADPVAFAALAADAKKFPHPPFDDPENILPLDPPRARLFNFKLINFERVTGVKIAARLFAKSPTAAEDAVPGAFMRALATRLGTIHRGAVAAYFADEDDWRVWIGDESTAAFFGRATSPADLSDGAAFHDTKEAFLAAACAQGDADFAKQQAAAPADKPVAPSQRVKLQADAILDGLILKLEPR